MFEEKVDLKHVINVESIKPHDLKRPSTHVAEQYEDTPEFRQSMNLKVRKYLRNIHVKRTLNCVLSSVFIGSLILELIVFKYF